MMLGRASVVLVLAAIGASQASPDSSPYPGQAPPGTTPVVFAPGIVSKGNIHSRLVFSPDGRELFWNTVDMKTFSTQIWSVRIVDGRWTAPEPPSFAREGSTKDVSFSPDGKRLLFDLDSGEGWGKRYVERAESGWSAPRVDATPSRASASFTRSGRAYFSAEMKTKVWSTGIFVANDSPDGYSDVKALNETINVPKAIDYTPYISPDETFLLFSSNRPLVGEKEDMHIHVSFKEAERGWSTPRRISDIQGRFPSLSPDQKYLFFCGDDGNIYWADREIIESFRPAVPRPADK